MDDKEKLALSDAVADELDALIREGLVERIPGDRYRLTPAGRAYTRTRYLDNGPAAGGGNAE